MPAFHLRAATESDADFLYDVIERTLRPHLEAAGHRWAAARMQQQCRHDALDAGTRIVVLARRDVGVQRMAVREGAVWLDMLALLPSAQGQGIGSALVGAARTDAAALALPLRLQVLALNPAQAFWQRHGFVVTARDERFVFMEGTARRDRGR